MTLICNEKFFPLRLFYILFYSFITLDRTMLNKEGSNYERESFNISSIEFNIFYVFI